MEFKAGHSHSRQSLPGLFHRRPSKGSRPRKRDSIVAHVGNAKYRQKHGIVATENYNLGKREECTVKIHGT